MAKHRITTEFYNDSVTTLTYLYDSIEAFIQLLPELPLTKVKKESVYKRAIKLSDSITNITEKLNSEYNKSLTKTEIREILSRANQEQIEQISTILKE